MPPESYVNSQANHTSSRWNGSNAVPLPLGQELIERGLITAEILDQALELQNSEGKGRLIGEILVDQGLVEEASVMEVVAAAYGLPVVRGGARLADAAIVDCLPREFVEEHGVLLEREDVRLGGARPVDE